MKKHIPNFITLLNLLSGCIAIVFVFENITLASCLVGIAAVFDFLDGFAARLLNAKSKFGKELDSLADVVSFGVAPGFIMFYLIQINSFQLTLSISQFNYLPFIAFIIPLFSALRLAKFNIDTRQEEIFYGLPTPANAILIASLPLILYAEPAYTIFDLSSIQSLISNSYFLILLTVVLSILLVANIPLMSLKFKTFNWTNNRQRYVFIGLSIIAIVLLQFSSIPIILLLYLILSFVF